MDTALNTAEHNELHFHGFEQDFNDRDLRVIISVGIDAKGNIAYSADKSLTKERIAEEMQKLFKP